MKIFLAIIATFALSACSSMHGNDNANYTSAYESKPVYDMEFRNSLHGESFSDR